MAFTRKSFYLVSIIVIILGFLSFYALNKLRGTEATRAQEFHVKNEASTILNSQQTNSSGTVFTNSLVPSVSSNNQTQASIIVTTTKVNRQNSVNTESTSVNHGMHVSYTFNGPSRYCSDPRKGENHSPTF